MKKLLVALTAAVVLAGCGKENYSDPQKFVEHYGHELLDEHFKSGMELMSYKGFEFSNAKVGVDRNGREYVSAQVSLTLSRGEKYYRRLATRPATDILKGWNTDNLARVVGQKDSQAFREAYHKARHDDGAPIVYSADAINIEKLVSPWRMIRIMRLKDGEGVYHPVGDIGHAVEWYDANGDEMSMVFSIPKEPFHTGVNGLLSEKAIKQFGALRDGTVEATQAKDAYVKRLMDINAAIERLNACCATQAEIMAMAPSYATTNAGPNWIWKRLQQERGLAQTRIKGMSLAAKERNQSAKRACHNEEAALRSLKSKVAQAEKSLARARKSLESDTKQFERLMAQTAKAMRPSERSNAKLEQMRERVTQSDPKAVDEAESNLAGLKEKLQKAEASLSQAKGMHSKLEEEGRAEIAKASADMEKTLSMTEKKLQEEYQAIKQKSSAELKAAIMDCKQKLGIVK